MKAKQLNVRLTEDDRRLIHAAAIIEGTSAGEFLLNAAGERVTKTLEYVLTGEPTQMPGKRAACMEFLELIGQADEGNEAKANQA